MEPKGEVFTAGEVARPFAVSEKASLRYPGNGKGSRRPAGDEVPGPTPQGVPVSSDHQRAVAGVYLDYNGSAPLDPRVADVMWAVLTEEAGNASSTHRFGRRQAAAVDEAREHVAKLVGGRASNVVFTAGATESNNLALRGAVEGAPAACRCGGSRSTSFIPSSSTTTTSKLQPPPSLGLSRDGRLLIPRPSRRISALCCAPMRRPRDQRAPESTTFWIVRFAN